MYSAHLCQCFEINLNKFKIQLQNLHCKTLSPNTFHFAHPKSCTNNFATENISSRGKAFYFTKQWGENCNTWTIKIFTKRRSITEEIVPLPKKNACLCRDCMAGINSASLSIQLRWETITSCITSPLLIMVWQKLKHFFSSNVRHSKCAVCNRNHRLYWLKSNLSENTHRSLILYYAIKLKCAFLRHNEPESSLKHDAFHCFTIIV